PGTAQKDAPAPSAPDRNERRCSFIAGHRDCRSRGIRPPGTGASKPKPVLRFRLHPVVEDDARDDGPAGDAEEVDDLQDQVDVPGPRCAVPQGLEVPDLQSRQYGVEGGETQPDRYGLPPV